MPCTETSKRGLVHYYSFVCFSYGLILNLFGTTQLRNVRLNFMVSGSYSNGGRKRNFSCRVHFLKNIVQFQQTRDIRVFQDIRREIVLFAFHRGLETIK